MLRYFLALVMLTGTVLLTGAQPANAPSDLEQFPTDIVGVTLYPDGQTPIIDLPVRVWSVDKDRMIYRTKTDKDGGFRIPSLNAGRCYIFVGRVKVDMKVLTDQKNMMVQHADWVVIMPRGLMVSKVPEMYDLLLTTPVLAVTQDNASGSKTTTSQGGSSTPKTQPQPKTEPPLEPPVVSP